MLCLVDAPHVSLFVLSVYFAVVSMILFVCCRVLLALDVDDAEGGGDFGLSSSWCSRYHVILLHDCVRIVECLFTVIYFGRAYPFALSVSYLRKIAWAISAQRHFRSCSPGWICFRGLDLVRAGTTRHVPDIFTQKFIFILLYERAILDKNNRPNLFRTSLPFLLR